MSFDKVVLTVHTILMSVFVTLLIHLGLIDLL